MLPHSFYVKLLLFYCMRSTISWMLTISIKGMKIFLGTLFVAMRVWTKTQGIPQLYHAEIKKSFKPAMMTTEPRIQDQRLQFRLLIHLLRLNQWLLFQPETRVTLDNMVQSQMEMKYPSRTWVLFESVTIDHDILYDMLPILYYHKRLVIQGELKKI